MTVTMVLKKHSSHTWQLFTKHSRHIVASFNCQTAEEALDEGRRWMSSFTIPHTVEIEYGDKHQPAAPQTTVPEVDI